MMCLKYLTEQYVPIIFSHYSWNNSAEGNTSKIGNISVKKERKAEPDDGVGLQVPARVSHEANGRRRRRKGGGKEKEGGNCF